MSKLSRSLTRHRSSALHLSLLAGLFAAPAILPQLALAQQPTQPGDSTVPTIDNSKFRAVGKVLSNNVYVRSGPSDNDYPVMKVDKGAMLTVVGRKFEWLKIVPPEGSFCYVAKAYVDRHGDGTQGKVTSTLNVRVGSTLNPLKTKLATKLEPGSDVTILGDQEEYYKIKPPEDVFLYVNLQFVEATEVISKNGESVATNKPATDTPTNPPVVADPKSEVKATETKTGVADGGTTAQPGGDTSGGDFGSDRSGENKPSNTQIAQNDPTQPTASPTTNPSTQPAMASADSESEFDRLELAYSEMNKKSLDQQDIPAIQAGYEKLASGSTNLPESLRRVAEQKASLLKNREKDRNEFVAVKKRQDEMAAKQMALRSEREEIEQRLQKTEIRYFTAVGVLRPSSLQQGSAMLYRLTDPANGRTVVYLRTNDNKIGSMLGQFIGVKGDVADDGQLSLRVIAPTEFETVDQAKLYTNVASQIVPPSLMPGGTGTAAATGE